MKIDYGKNNTAFHHDFKRLDPGGCQRNPDGSMKPEKQVRMALKLFRDYLERTLNYDWSEWSDIYDAQQEEE